MARAAFAWTGTSRRITTVFTTGARRRGGTIDGWFLLAVAAGFAGYVLYVVGLRRSLVRPSRASWLIWATATGVEAATYAAINPGAPQAIVFMVSAGACAAVTLALWHRSNWSPPDAGELVCIAASLAAIALWLGFRETFWAHMLVVAAVPVSFWPTWRSVIADRAHERSPSWGLWTVGDLATLLLATRSGSQDIGEYAYILVELACHASVWLMIGLATINPWRSLGRRFGGVYVVDGYAPATGVFRIGETHLGKAVFAAQGFSEGAAIVAFSGARVTADKLPRRMIGRRDRFVQIAPWEYMGPSGAIDDLINHSCAPNAGLRFLGERVVLTAIRDIAPGEEIAWDYSTTLSDPGWQMACRCGAPECRGRIGAFDTLAPERQEWFRARNLVAPYLRRRDRIRLPDRAA